MNFFIFGLPRSRTAWTANFLTYDHTYCHHELVSEVGDVLTLKRQLHAREGVADTGLIHRPAEILHHFPSARLVLMTGAERSWRRFADRLTLPPGVVAQVEADFRRTDALLGDKALRINVDRLMESIATAHKLWTHCTASKTFDGGRWNMLRRMNVQATEESIHDRLTRALS